MKRKAFTLTEVVVTVLILGIMAGALVLSPNSSKQSAKREAERTAAKINRLIATADRMHITLWIDVKDDSLEIRTSKRYDADDEPQEKFPVTPGCSYSRYQTTKHFSYNVSSSESVKSHENFTMNNINVDVDTDPQGKYNIQVKDSASSLYYVVIKENES